MHEYLMIDDILIFMARTAEKIRRTLNTSVYYCLAASLVYTVPFNKP
jgi:hypothetical protein